MSTPITVHPPGTSGERLVTAHGTDMGLATGIADLVEFIRRANLDPDQVRLDDKSLVEWRGGGPDVWG